MINDNYLMCFAVGILFAYICNFIGSLENLLIEKALMIRAQRKLIKADCSKDSFLIRLFKKFKGDKNG